MSRFTYSVDDLSVYPTFNDADVWPVEQLVPDPGHTFKKADASHANHDTTQSGQDFDETLQKLWDDADKKQLFRYSLRNVPTKIVSDKFRFILQLNPERATKRRAPQEIQHVSQPFNPDEFNFNKVRSEETILTLKSLDQPSPNSPQEAHSHTCSLIINVSPLEYCHVLLVPDPTLNQSQAITTQGLKSAVEVLLLSHSCDFRVGFNSLCGFASVNHHHYHTYYLKHRLYIEYAELKNVAGPYHEFKDPGYPAPGFILVLKDLKDLNSFLQSCFRLISYLQRNDIAHNMYITRGSSQNIKNYFDCIRLIVWGRASSFGSKVCHAFNPALCELAGHFPLKSESPNPIYSLQVLNRIPDLFCTCNLTNAPNYATYLACEIENEESYSTMTEEFIFNELRGICQSTFEQVKAQVGLLWQDCKNEDNAK